MAGVKKRKDAPTAAFPSTKKTKKTADSKPAAPAPTAAPKNQKAPRKRAADYYSDSEAEEAAGWEGFDDGSKKKGSKAAAVKKDSKPAPKKAKKTEEKREEEKKMEEKPKKKTDEELEKTGELITVEELSEDEEDHAAAYLKGFESSEDESDAEDDAPEEKGRGDMSNAGIPHAKKTQKKLRAAQKSDKRGIIAISRVPHGFYEHEMRSYFSQFGEVTRLRLSRNKKTGRSKHYAFLEFANDSVAEIVADTMDNYLLFGHILKCKVLKELTPEQIERLFKGANKRFKVIPRGKIAKRESDKPKSEEQWKKVVVREDERREKKRQQLKELGIDYEFEVAKPIAPAAEAVEEKEEKKEEPKAITEAGEAPENKEEVAAAEAIADVLAGGEKDKKEKKEKKEKAKVPATRKSKRTAKK